MDCSMPGFPVLHCLLEFAQIHVLGNNCSLQHWTLLSPPDSCTTEHHLHFGPAASFFLELLVITPLLFPVAYHIGHLLTWGAHLLVSYHFPSHIICGVLLARILWGGLPLPPPVDHVLAVLFTMTRPSWVALLHWVTQAPSSQGCDPWKGGYLGKWKLWDFLTAVIMWEGREEGVKNAEGIMICLERVRYEGKNNDLSFQLVDFQEPSVGYPHEENQ